MPFEYLTNTPLEEALAVYRQRLTAAGCAAAVEQIPTVEAAGRRTAAAVYARRSVPHYLACAMDGLAVAAAATFGATETTPVDLLPGQYVSVDTGDVLPEGCDAVVMIEEVIWQNGQARLIQAAAPWQHIRQIGEDFCAGDMLLPRETLLTPASLGILLAGGIGTVAVYRVPVILIIPTGDEIVPPAQNLQPGEIPEFNATVFAAMLRQAGAETRILPIVPDQPDLLAASLGSALKEADWVLILAGSSAGRGDHTARVIGSLGETIIHGLAIRPGKPAILGLCGRVPVLGIPGYPISGLIVLEKVLLPLLRETAHLPAFRRPQIAARLSRRILSSLKYQEFVRVRLSWIHSAWIATPLERGAGLLASFTRADGLLEIPQNLEGLEAGSAVTVSLLRDLDEIGRTLGVTGSHDPLLDELSELFHAADGGEPRYHLSSTHVGSMGGLMAIRRDEAHVAGIHLLDQQTGQYNRSYLERYFPDGAAVLIEGVRRQQGLMVAGGNPKAIRGLAGLADGTCRYVNRQKGSGTRLLLDYHLEQLGIRPDQISGYRREEMTHTGVAAQIAAGSADAGLGILSAARIFHLDFIPIAEECYDFVISKDQFDSPMIRRFLSLLQSAAFAERLKQMGGYRLVEPGRRILEQP